MILVAIQRFGAQWQWVAGAALACLIAWLLWQRRERQTRPHA
jgi:membrane protein implicated in regulation of membrane protease activity